MIYRKTRDIKTLVLSRKARRDETNATGTTRIGDQMNKLMTTKLIVELLRKDDVYITSAKYLAD
jgi:hypothetical protein